MRVTSQCSKALPLSLLEKPIHEIKHDPAVSYIEDLELKRITYRGLPLPRFLISTIDFVTSQPSPAVALLHIVSRPSQTLRAAQPAGNAGISGGI
eukprot:6211184-Pleurochrysis_carterae.AAC.2